MKTATLLLIALLLSACATVSEPIKVDERIVCVQPSPEIATQCMLVPIDELDTSYYVSQKAE